jgi:hypothetical protein
MVGVDVPSANDLPWERSMQIVAGYRVRHQTRHRVRVSASWLGLLCEWLYCTVCQLVGKWLQCSTLPPQHTVINQ